MSSHQPAKKLALLAIFLFASSPIAFAEQADKSAPNKPPATVSPVATSKAAVAPAAAKPPKKAVAASACKGLNEKVCRTTTACTWIAPKTVDAKTAKPRTAYCRKLGTVAAKKPVAADGSAKAIATPATPPQNKIKKALAKPSVTPQQSTTVKPPAPAN